MSYILDVTVAKKAESEAGTLICPLSKEEVQALNGQHLEDAVNEDLNGFNEYFCRNLDNSVLRGEEIAILKTYLYYKVHKLEASVDGTPDAT